jgi:N-acetylglucosaminyldiphosphoundecaprenol N-acetyl-beta-D-mannosaminyltransferase
MAITDERARTQGSAAPITAGGGATSQIFDIPVDLAQPADLLERITGWVGDGGGARRVMYVNAHVLNQSQESPALHAALTNADLVYCDGYGVRLAAKAMEAEIPHRMTGADWVWGLASLCETAELSVYLLGSDPGVAAEAAARLHRWYPRLRIVGTHHGYFDAGSEHDKRVVEDINRKRPDIVLVGMGSPKQEAWVQAHAHELDTDVLWTVGALFDYVSGRVPRAPAWLADNGLEWIFRLAIEPNRMWRRYLLGNPVFVSRVMAQARHHHAAHG